MQIKYDPITITGDDTVIARAAELGVHASETDIEGLRVDADTLSKLFLVAERKGDDKTALAQYIAMKQAFIASN
ncbi:hypothetical protein [Sporosarcina newyorkensis]|uniref:Uncharacterized protein n=1 Tax=Sporosarcina newyorkensis TaxID=759851 RepID=A0A1T4XI11_9BACL|nr:hypothetical protein [Sporosarcina newyorkensis]SKA88748.1 hypothetical protein SAMN04244570_0734 [Sporosarcina newyorkensis]